MMHLILCFLQAEHALTLRDIIGTWDCVVLSLVFLCVDSPLGELPVLYCPLETLNAIESRRYQQFSTEMTLRIGLEKSNHLRDRWFNIFEIRFFPRSLHCYCPLITWIILSQKR